MVCYILKVSVPVKISEKSTADTDTDPSKVPPIQYRRYKGQGTLPLAVKRYKLTGEQKVMYIALLQQPNTHHSSMIP